MIPRPMSGRRCSAVTLTAAALVLLTAVIAAGLPTGAQASAMRPVPVQSSAIAAVIADDDNADRLQTRHRRDALPGAPVADARPPAAQPLARKKRTILKLKPLIVLPAKVALGAGAKLVAGAKLGVKAVGLGAKALGVGAVGLKAVKKVAKVTVKAATALGVKAVLLNFLFQKINQAIDFKTRLLSNLDQKNREQNAQFLAPVLPHSGSSSKTPSAGSIGNKDEPFNGAAEASVPTGFVTAGFAPGSDLIASTPPGFARDSRAFTNFPSVPEDAPAAGPAQESAAAPQGFPAAPQGFADAGRHDGFGPIPLGFAATNDDGSPASENSF